MNEKDELRKVWQLGVATKEWQLEGIEGSRSFMKTMKRDNRYIEEKMRKKRCLKER